MHYFQLRLVTKIVAASCDFELKVHYNAFVAGQCFAPDPTSGAFRAPQTPYSWAASQEGRGRKGEEGSVPPLFTI